MHLEQFAIDSFGPPDRMTAKPCGRASTLIAWLAAAPPTLLKSKMLLKLSSRVYQSLTKELMLISANISAT